MFSPDGTRFAERKRHRLFIVQVVQLRPGTQLIEEPRHVPAGACAHILMRRLAPRHTETVGQQRWPIERPVGIGLRREEPRWRCDLERDIVIAGPHGRGWDGEEYEIVHPGNQFLGG